MKKTIYRNGKGGYGSIVANKQYNQKMLHGAYTASALQACKMVVLKNKEYYSTGRGVPYNVLKDIIGQSAINYWINTKGWLVQVDGRVRADVGAINTLNARYSGTAPTFNNNRSALQLVASIMRTGGENDIGFQPSKYEIEA